MLRVGAQKLIDIFEEPENHRVFVDDKIPKEMIFSQSLLYMAIQGYSLMLKGGAQQSI